MKKTSLIKLAVIGLIILPNLALAQALVGTITRITNVVTLIGTALVVLMVVVAGILFVTSSGDPGKVGTAKACLLWAILGGIVIGAATIIATLV